MALPILGALLGAAGSIGSGVLGMQASNNAAAYNYAIDLMNYYQREQERQDTIQQARRTERDQKLGGTDAMGNRTHFVEGVGWVSELSDEQQRLRDLYQREETDQLTKDLPMRRRRMQETDRRQDEEGSYADRILLAMQRMRRDEPRDLEALMNEASVRGITQGFDSAAEDGLRHSLRTGSNAGKIDARIGEARANALEQAFLQNRLNSRSMANDTHMQNLGNMANLYNMFQSRATQTPDATYNPRNIEGAAGQQMGQFAQLAQGGASALVNAMAKQGGSMPRIEPNFGAANAVGQAGNSLAGAFERIGANQNRSSAQQMYQNYIFGQGGQPKTNYNDMFKAGTGLF